MTPPSFQGQPLSRREIAIAREAMVKGAQHARLFPCQSDNEDFARWASGAYPLPQIQRPREVKDGMGARWRYVRGLEWRTSEKELWQGLASYGSCHITENRIHIWADLLAAPTETVDDPGDDA